MKETKRAYVFWVEILGRPTKRFHGVVWQYPKNMIGWNGHMNVHQWARKIALKKGFSTDVRARMGFDVALGSPSWPEGMEATARQSHTCPSCENTMQRGDKIFWHKIRRNDQCLTGWSHKWFCGQCHNTFDFAQKSGILSK